MGLLTRSLGSAASAALLTAAGPASAAGDADPTGIWRTENGTAAVKLHPCDSRNGLCGTVWWLEPGEMRYDRHNPDPAKRDRPLCGLTVLWSFRKDGARTWEDGKLYKPDEGEIYNAYFKLRGDDRLKVSGYIGFQFISKSQTWTRVSRKQYPRCAPPADPAPEARGEAGSAPGDTASGK